MCQSQELLGIFFKSLALLKENNKLNKAISVNIEITSDDEISHVLPKRLWILVCNTNVNNLVDQTLWNPVDVFVLNKIVHYLLKVLLLWKHCHRLQERSVNINRQLKALLSEDVSGEEIFFSFSFFLG